MSRYEQHVGFIDKLQQWLQLHTDIQNTSISQEFLLFVDYCLQQNIFDIFQVFNTKTILFHRSLMLQSFDDGLY